MLQGYSQQVAKSFTSVAGGATETIVHTVAAGKNLYLKLAALSASGGGGRPRLVVYNAAGVEQYDLAAIAPGGYAAEISNNFDCIIIPAGFEIRHKNGNADEGGCNIFGWEL